MLHVLEYLRANPQFAADLLTGASSALLTAAGGFKALAFFQHDPLKLHELLVAVKADVSTIHAHASSVWAYMIATSAGASAGVVTFGKNAFRAFRRLTGK